MFPAEMVKQALDPTFRAIFQACAAKWGEHWHLKNFEASALVSGWTPIVQQLLAKLGSHEQVLVGMAIMTTTAVVGGKVAQNGIKRASSTASTRTPTSGASSASSASVDQERPIGLEDFSEMDDAA